MKGKPSIPPRHREELEARLKRHAIETWKDRCREVIVRFRVSSPTWTPSLSGDIGRRGLGIDQNPPFIDVLHRSILFWKEEKRKDLVGYLSERDLLGDGPFWKLAQALFEVLPRDLEDWKLVNALLGERQTLRAEGKREAFKDQQQQLL